VSVSVGVCCEWPVCGPPYSGALASLGPFFDRSCLAHLRRHSQVFGSGAHRRQPVIVLWQDVEEAKYLLAVGEFDEQLAPKVERYVGTVAEAVLQPWAKVMVAGRGQVAV